MLRAVPATIGSHHQIWPWLAATNLVAFAAQGIEVGGRPLVDLAVPSGAAIDAGEWWRPLTSLVVHPGGWAHLGINTCLLLLSGPPAEGVLGPRKFLATYAGAGFAANALRYTVGGRRGGGASAAIFATAGAAGARAMLRSGHRHLEPAATTLAAISFVGGGILLAATVGDNHLLAMGLGALCGRAADGEAIRSKRPDGFDRAVAVVAAAGLLGMALRSILSSPLNASLR